MTRFISSSNIRPDGGLSLSASSRSEVIQPPLPASQPEEINPLSSASIARSNAGNIACLDSSQQTTAPEIIVRSGVQIPVMLPATWFRIRSFEHGGRLWDAPSKLYQGVLLNTVGRINYFAEKLNYSLSSRSPSTIEQHIMHTKQHESFHAITQAVVSGLGIASLATGIPFLGGSSLLHIGIVVGLAGIFNGASIVHQRAQRGQCERILARLRNREDIRTNGFRGQQTDPTGNERVEFGGN